MSPRLIKQYDNTDDVALHDIATQLCSAIAAGRRRAAESDGTAAAYADFLKQRRELIRSLEVLRIGDRRGTIRLIGMWTEEAESLVAVGSGRSRANRA